MRVNEQLSIDFDYSVLQKRREYVVTTYNQDGEEAQAFSFYVNDHGRVDRQPELRNLKQDESSNR